MPRAELGRVRMGSRGWYWFSQDLDDSGYFTWTNDPKRALHIRRVMTSNNDCVLELVVSMNAIASAKVHVGSAGIPDSISKNHTESKWNWLGVCERYGSEAHGGVSVCQFRWSAWHLKWCCFAKSTFLNSYSHAGPVGCAYSIAQDFTFSSCKFHEPAGRFESWSIGARGRLIWSPGSSPPQKIRKSSADQIGQQV